MDALTDNGADIGIDSKPQAERDRIDLNHEISGDSTGRMRRFFAGDQRGLYGESEKKKAERRFHDMLDMLLAEDPFYAKLYYQVAEKIEKAQQAVNLALIDLNQQLEASERNLKVMREQAAELPDGTKVFKSHIDHGLYTEDGKRLRDDQAQDIQLPNNAPSWEDYKNEKAAHDKVVRQKEEVESYRHDVLDHAQKRMNDKDDPPSMDELKELNAQIQSKMPDIVKSHGHNVDMVANDKNDQSISFAHKIEKTRLDVPDMNRSFDLARLNIPDLDKLPDDKPSLTIAPRQ